MLYGHKPHFLTLLSFIWKKLVYTPGCVFTSFGFLHHCCNASRKISPFVATFLNGPWVHFNHFPIGLFLFQYRLTAVWLSPMHLKNWQHLFTTSMLKKPRSLSVLMSAIFKIFNKKPQGRMTHSHDWTLIIKLYHIIIL